jgi:hypothetical protein
VIDSAHPAASWFLWITAGFMVLAVVLPLLLVPLSWARTVGWKIPEESDLTVYLGRSLGAVAAALCAGIARAATDVAAHAVVIELSIVAGGLLTLVHIVGALQRRQPPAETAEILVFAGLTVAMVLVYRSL